MVGDGQADQGFESMVRPIKLAHVVLKTSRYRELLDWYKKVLGAWASFENDSLAFLTYDDEHHRVAFVNVPGLADQDGGRAGVHHIAFTYAGLQELLATHDRLERTGIRPIWAVNHGPTTSIYYADPDGNQLEFQVENFDTEEEANAFFGSEDFRLNPIGVDFDPADLKARLEAGESEASLKRRPDIGARGMEGVPLR
jgi:catechol-2,3-dioxygenase